jgi:hypothetical protein
MGSALVAETGFIQREFMLQNLECGCASVPRFYSPERRHSSYNDSHRDIQASALCQLINRLQVGVYLEGLYTYRSTSHLL